MAAVNGINGLIPHRNGTSSDYTVPFLINGNEVTTEATFKVTSPSTNQPIWSSSSASVSDAVAAAEAAQAAFPAWRATKPSFRRDLLLKAADIFSSRALELVGYMNSETGSENSYSAGFNIPSSIEQFKDIAGRIVTVVGTQPECAQEGKYALVMKEPYGVILSIAPWNAPYILGLRAITNAIAGGNTVVLKGSELSPRCFWAIGSVLTQAGFPPGVVNVIYHRPEDAPAVTSALINHPDVKKVNFTGSTATGSIIAQQCGKALKPVLMELGGKAPAIVLPDADLKKAALAVVQGAFVYSGQVCMSTERICVHESIRPQFEAALIEACEELYPSSGDVPVLIGTPSIKKNHALMSDALSKGARLVAGDPSAPDPTPTRMRPIIIADVTRDMEVYYTESFGPTVSLLTFSTEEEALQLANDTEYGLAAAVFTEDLGKGLRIAKRIETGAVHINAMSVHDEPNLPHGGAKKSGWGRFNGNAGIEEFLVSKTVTWLM